jgi:hypothetical protein
MHCIGGLVGYCINANRQNLALYLFSKTSKISKILHFFSKQGVTEIFSCSAVKADLEEIPDIAPNCRFYFAENFVPEWMPRRNLDLNRFSFCIWSNRRNTRSKLYIPRDVSHIIIIRIVMVYDAQNGFDVCLI